MAQPEGYPRSVKADCLLRDVWLVVVAPGLLQLASEQPAAE